MILFQSLRNFVHLLCSIRVQCGAKTPPIVVIYVDSLQFVSRKGA